MKIKLTAILSFLILLSGCHTFKSTDLNHFQYEKLPLKAKATKEGKACKEYSLFSLSFNSKVDFTIEAAKKDGQITEIVSVENEVYYSPLTRRECLVVKGN